MYQAQNDDEVRQIPFMSLWLPLKALGAAFLCPWGCSFVPVCRTTFTSTSQFDMIQCMLYSHAPNSVCDCAFGSVCGADEGGLVRQRPFNAPVGCPCGVPLYTSHHELTSWCVAMLQVSVDGVFCIGCYTEHCGLVRQRPFITDTALAHHSLTCAVQSMVTW